MPKSWDNRGVLTPPLASVTGEARPYWTPADLPKCPFGLLVCAVCPGAVPRAVFEALHPAEREYAGTLEGDRHREWTAGRLCLSSALARLSPTRVPLLVRSSGAPCLPVGIAGSISHKGPLTMALSDRMTRGIGIDVECAEHGDERLAQRVLTTNERLSLSDLDDEGAAMFVAVHFAAKEAIYKMLSTEEQLAVDFEDIELLAPPLKVMMSTPWAPVSARVHALPTDARVAVFLDGQWVIAAARRD